ncbi:MAG: ABC transporter permease subunit [Actinobacteria bacterium]|jgi:putative spermidine/putrescine transport system permease protein|nr:ABC transporter permease subunit [Actinomycetota bacterium]
MSTNILEPDATPLEQGDVVAVAATAAPNDPILRIGRWLAAVTALICLAPIPLVLAVATTRVWQQGFWAGGFTLEWLANGWQRIAPNFAFSLRIAVLVLIIDLLIGLPAAWLIARRRFPGRRALQALSTVPIAIPGIALALGLILAYPTWKAGGWLLIAGHVLYTLPFMLGALTPTLGRRDLIELEAVAATLGASFPARLLTVTLPQIRTSLLAATIMVVTLSLGEFNVSFFLYTVMDTPLPVELYSGYITMRLEVAAATTVWFLALVVPAAIALERLGGAKVGQA